MARTVNEALRLMVTMGGVLILSAAWPALARLGLAWSGDAAWLDAVLVFAPLAWAPLPALVLGIGRGDDLASSPVSAADRGGDGSSPSLIGKELSGRAKAA